MKVKELLEVLGKNNPESTVLLMSQRSWPFERDVFGVVARADMPPDEDEDEVEPPPTTAKARVMNDGTTQTDVFIVEGEQLRYGTQMAWGRRGLR